ncbi:MAG: hypothetical protein AAGE52_28540 [Myxococcota bacterium]
MRFVALVAALALASLGPTPAAACDTCPRDGSRHVLVGGEFVRYQAVRFVLHFRVQDGDREWVDRVPVVPMALPEKDGEAVAWSSLQEGDFLEINVRETEDDRVVTRVVVIRSASRS